MNAAARQIVMSLIAIVLALIIIIGLLNEGDSDVRRLTLLAATLGCLSQFIGQSALVVARRTSGVLVYAAFVLVLMAIWRL